MHLHWTEYVLWFAAPSIQALIVFFMVKKRLRQEYPAFFTYTLYQVLSLLLLFAVWVLLPYRMYFYAFWTTSALSVLISFVVMHEVFAEAFRPYEALRDLGAMLFRWSGLILLMLAVLSATVTRTYSSDIVQEAMVTLERSVLMMQCGLVLFLLLFSKYLGISKRHYLFGIALGFGINASVDLIINAVQSHFGFMAVTTLRLISSTGYNIAALAWLTYTVMPAPARRKAEVLPQSERWNSALAVAMDLPPSEGFLGDMERTVDRLLHQRGAAELKHKAG